MIIHDVAQNTPEWHFLRAGIPTASAFDKIITKSGKPSAQAEKYMFRLLAERIKGEPLEERFTWAMERGSALEKKAVQYYEFQTDYKTVPVGFVTDDKERWGASPDRFVGEHGNLEIKCPEIDAHMMYLMKEGSAYEEYKIQAQGQLWISEREWVDFLSYHPDLPWSLVRVPRDEAFIKLLAKAVNDFADCLEVLAGAAHEKGWFRRDSIRQPKSAQEQLISDLKASLIERNNLQVR